VPAAATLSDSSDVAYAVIAGSALWTAQPKGASASIASVPTEITPYGLSSHRLAGIENVAVPRPTSVNSIPVKPFTGGRGAPSRNNARSWSTPGRANSSDAG
jgi:hypothetical protein